MANHKNAKKCIRKIQKRTMINKHRKSMVRTDTKKAEIALGLHGGKPVGVEEASNLVRLAESQLMRGAQKGILTKKTASRKVSRLVKHLKALQAS